jgi:para-nitrobenzyl esterase
MPSTAAARAASADELVTAGMAVYAQVPDEAPGTLAFAPIVDGDLLPEAPATVLHEGRGLPVPS